MSQTSILLCRTPQAAAEWCREGRARGATLGLVPTMGALHAGHLELVRRALRECNRVVASVFVNPLQFNDPRDYERYPRTLERDVELLESAGCQMVFTGTLGDFFPNDLRPDGSLDRAALIEPGPAALGLEGEYRPGHFAGVATIVQRLFEVSEPTRAYFGQKDFQQTLVVRDLARRRGRPEIVVCPTVRAADGLALSSRNLLLDASGREQALAIVRALRAARSSWQQGERLPRLLVRVMRDVLNDSLLETEYAEVRDPEQWSAQAPRTRLQRAVALIAARAGRVRLIDNMYLHQSEDQNACKGA